jgi:hypothetical protein
MSVDKKLLVEGDLDASLLGAVFSPYGWLISQLKNGGKRGLKSRTKWERRDNKSASVYYVRDRDFDHEPELRTGPHEMGENDPGFRWSRHEIENYILDPLIVTEALQLDLRSYEEALIAAGERIKHYQAARWAVGLVRATLLYPSDLETRPEGIGSNDFKLPDNLEKITSRQWALTHTGAFLTKVGRCLDQNLVTEEYDVKAGLFEGDGFMTVENVLLWFSGKDLLTGLREWFQMNRINSPKAFCKIVESWIIRKSTAVLELIPEWKALLDTLERAEN